MAGIGTYAGRGARAWLLAIVRNACFAWLAKNRPRSLMLVGDMAEGWTQLAGAGDEPGATPEAELMRQADTARDRTARWTACRCRFARCW